LAEAEELFGVPKPPPRTLAESIPGWGRPVDPAGDCEFSASGDSLILKIPGTLHSLSPANNNFDAPRVLQEIEGDFTLQVKVAFPLEPKTPLTDRAFTFISAGLVVWENADHSLRVERDAYFTHPNYPTGAVIPPPSQTPPQLSSHAPLVEYMQGALEVSGIPKSWNAKDPPLPGPATWLRLTRRGQKFESYLSHDGREWQIVPVIETKFPSQVQVGVVARNNSGSEFRAEFSDVQLTRP
jgi:regulation of enolase protein 1 (concanavalin A-like superfamily)